MFAIDFKVNRPEATVLVESGIDENDHIAQVVEDVVELTSRVLGNDRYISTPQRAFRHAGAYMFLSFCLSSQITYFPFLVFINICLKCPRGLFQ